MAQANVSCRTSCTCSAGPSRTRGSACRAHGQQGGRARKERMQSLCSVERLLLPLPTHPKGLFSVPAWPPIPAAQQKDRPHLAFSHSGLVTMQSPSPHLPLPWPLCLGRCEILIASLGTGLFLSVVSDQNIILSCKYNYQGGGREEGGLPGRTGSVHGRGVERGCGFFFLNRLSPVC